MLKINDKAVESVATVPFEYTLTDEQKQAFVDATQSVRDDFVKEFGEAGQTMLDLAAKYE